MFIARVNGAGNLARTIGLLTRCSPEKKTSQPFFGHAKIRRVRIHMLTGKIKTLMVTFTIAHIYCVCKNVKFSTLSKRTLPDT